MDVLTSNFGQGALVAAHFGLQPAIILNTTQHFDQYRQDVVQGKVDGNTDVGRSRRSTLFFKVYAGVWLWAMAMF